MLGELFRQVANALAGHSCLAFIAPFDVRLPRADEPDEAVDTVVQPDLSVICDPGKLDERGCRGAPDWVVEVLSPATAAHDHIVKRAVYERAGVREYCGSMPRRPRPGAGVREYWLVHPVDRIVTIYRLEAGRFGVPEAREFSGCHAVGMLPEVVIDWEPIAAITAP